MELVELVGGVVVWQCEGGGVVGVGYYGQGVDVCHCAGWLAGWLCCLGYISIGYAD